MKLSTVAGLVIAIAIVATAKGVNCLVKGIAIAIAIVATAKGTTLECGSQKTLSPGVIYTIQSPDYPNNYPKNTDCQNRFKVNKKCRKPQVVCDEFDVRGRGNCKKGDKFTVKTNKKTRKQRKSKKKPKKKPKKKLKTKTFCGNRTIRYSAAGSTRMNFLFASNKKSQGSGYSCEVSCKGTIQPNATSSTVGTTEGPTTTDTTDGPTTSAGPCNCGVPNRVNRIVGGEETEANECPWQVGLVISGRGLGSNIPICGGSLITTQTVLTAAHCTDRRSAGDFAVLVGEHDTTIQDGEFKVKVKQIIQHPQYNSANTDNDFSLLTLKTAVEWGNSVKPVCLPTKQSADYEDIEAIVSGWGATSSGGELSATLQEVDVVTMTNSACTTGTLYSSSKVTSNMLCAAEKDMNGGKDACQGDSGGPLITKENNGSYSQIGVVSWGIGCAQANAPGVYSRVTAHLQWIKDNMQGATCPML